MPEEFLQFIWEQQLQYKNSLNSVSNEKIEILQPGNKNTDAGPDFFNAKIKIENTIWAGNIEIHKKSSDWYVHNHHNDKAFDNVILHVVEEYDKPVKNSLGGEIPALILKYPKKLQINYQQLLDSKSWIPCQEQFFTVDLFVLKMAFHRLMVERLEAKTSEIITRLEENKNNWNETFYQFLAKMFGFKTNALPFELLAKSLPLPVIAKHKNKLFQIEALLYGNAGLLNEQLLGDSYFLKLRDEYSFLFRKYKLKPIEMFLWKFMRLRPGNFPSVRIAQFAALIHQSESLFSKILEIESIEKLKQLLNVKASDYWDTHYRFNKSSPKKVKELGDASINLLIINVVVPFLFVYGDYHSKYEFKDRAFKFLEMLPAEHNSIITKWEILGVKPRSAFETQALLQLKNVYCRMKKCLFCQVGNKLIKKTFLDESAGK